MNISGIRPYQAINNYFKIEDAQAAPVSPKRQPADQADGFRQKQADPYEEAKIRERQTETAFDFAQKFDPDATYRMKGKDSDLEGLDVASTISGTYRDEVLRQYSYFIKPEDFAAQQEQTAESGIKENFDLT